ncbi:MAG: hypothetical protein ACRELB_22450, partial [Polyangiaceae bacterium]
MARAHLRGLLARVALAPAPALALALTLTLTLGGAGVASAGGPAIVKGPYLTGLSDDGVDVRFELDGAAAATVEVRVEGGAGGRDAGGP